MWRVRRLLAAVVTCGALGLAAVCAAVAADGRLVTGGDVSLRVPSGWVKVQPLAEAASLDPRTLLVVGTEDAAARRSPCRVSGYRVPDDGAVVVVVGWRGVAPGGFTRGRGPLNALRLQREYFECFDGRGAAAQFALDRRLFQVNVLVGDDASARVVAQALEVARSFAVAD